MLPDILLSFATFHFASMAIGRVEAGTWLHKNKMCHFSFSNPAQATFIETTQKAKITKVYPIKGGRGGWT